MQHSVHRVRLYQIEFGWKSGIMFLRQSSWSPVKLQVIFFGLSIRVTKNLAFVTMRIARKANSASSSHRERAVRRSYISALGLLAYQPAIPRRRRVDQRKSKALIIVWILLPVQDKQMENIRLKWIVYLASERYGLSSRNFYIFKRAEKVREWNNEILTDFTNWTVFFAAS